MSFIPEIIGHSFGGPLEDDIDNDFFVALQMKVSEELRPEMRSLDQMMVGLHRLSSLLARYVPWSRHLAMLNDYLLATVGSPHVEFVPLTTQECYAILSIILLPKASTVQFEGQQISGLGLKAASALFICWNINWLHKQANVKSPVIDDRIKSLLNNARLQPTNGAPTVDSAQFLLSLVFILCWVLAGRISEVCHYCPTIEDIELPTSATHFDEDNYPKWIIVKLHVWKGTNCRDYPIYVHRNYTDTRFCPVQTIFDWINIAKISRGPIIPRLDRTNTSVLMAHHLDRLETRRSAGAMVWYSEGNEPINMSTRSLAKEFSTLFQNAKYNTQKMHIIRKSSIMWMARGGFSTAQIKAFSRHSDQSTSYFRYIQERILESELYTANGSIDPPIFTIWPPKPAAVTTTLARSNY